MVGNGFTVTFAVVVVEQPFAVAVIVNCVVCIALLVFTNMPVMLLPVPPAAMPVRFTVFVLVQVKIVPATAFGLVIANAVTDEPEHIVCDAGATFTVGDGFTVTETEVEAEHP